MTDQVVWLRDGAQGLPAGLAGGRYRCRACQEALILKGSRPGAKVVPHFAHQGDASCARRELETQLDADLEVVIRLRDRIGAIRGVRTTLEVIGDPAEGALAGLPPAIVAVCGRDTFVVEHPGPRLPDSEVLRRRVAAVREHRGGAEHVWFLRKDPLQFAAAGSLPVLVGGERSTHATVAPTEQQLAIVAAGGIVYWLDGQLVLVPYGVHRFLHPVRPEQEWTRWPRWRSDPREDWRISKPRPAAGADCWGLVPLNLSSMTGGRAVFQPVKAHGVMDQLFASQEGRHRWRNQRAREVYAERHRPARPPVAPDGAAEEPPEPESSASERGSAAAQVPPEQVQGSQPVPPSAPPVPAPPQHPPATFTPEPEKAGALRRMLRGLLRRRGR